MGNNEGESSRQRSRSRSSEKKRGSDKRKQHRRDNTEHRHSDRRPTDKHTDRPKKQVEKVPKEVPLKVFVQRDYSLGTECKFDTSYPTKLEDVVPRETFTDTINKINELFARAEELNCPTYTEGCLSCMTGYLLYFCIETRYAKEMKQISMFVQRQNDEIYHPRGVHVVEPMLRGLRCIEFIVYPKPNKRV